MVTTPRSDVMYVVTEYGITNLKGKWCADRARSLINLAHPDFRAELERQAYECVRSRSFIARAFSLRPDIAHTWEYPHCHPTG